MLLSLLYEFNLLSIELGPSYVPCLHPIKRERVASPMTEVKMSKQDLRAVVKLFNKCGSVEAILSEA